jgi:hypothetical protein
LSLRKRLPLLGLVATLVALAATVAIPGRTTHPLLRDAASETVRAAF